MKRRRSLLRKVGSGSTCKVQKENKLNIYNLIVNKLRYILKKLQLDVISMIIPSNSKQADFIRRKLHGTLDFTENHVENGYLWANNMWSIFFYGEIVFTDETFIFLIDN